MRYISSAFLCSLLLFSCGKNNEESESSNIEYESGAYLKGHREGDKGISHGWLAAESINFLVNNSERNLSGNSFLSLISASIAEVQAAIDKVDRDEIDFVLLVPTYVGHFYNPITKTNYLGGKNPTARSRIDEHYLAIKKAYSQGNMDKAVEHLGRSLHFLSDACFPHHAANKIAGLSWHTQSEKFVDNLILTEPERIKPQERLNVSYGTAGEFVHDCATFALSKFPLMNSSERCIKGKKKCPNYSNWKKAALEFVPYTQQITAEYVNFIVKSLK